MIEFICGRSGRGKTQYVFDAVKHSLEEDAQRAIYVIVPDQMSFQTEFSLLQQIPRGAMARVEVLGLSRFLTQMIEYLEPTRYTVFDSLAQKMLLLQAGMEQKQDLEVYRNVIDKPEFIEYLQQFARALKGTGLSLDVLSPYHRLEASQPLLYKKLEETNKIFSYYQTQLEPDMFDIADKMNYYLRLLEKPANKEKLRNINVYVDGFYTFNKLETEVLKETFKCANQAKMTFAFDVRERVKPHSIFSLVHQQFLAFSENLNVTSVRIDSKNHRFVLAQPLSELERNYEKPTALRFAADKDAPIDMSMYQTIEQEVIGIAQAIRQKMLTEDVRAKEIAVYLPEKALYGPMIEKYFAMYDIPYYLDLKDSMLIHPVFNWFYSLLDVIKNNWQMDDILNVLHNDFFRTQHEISVEEYYLFVDFVQQIKYPYKSIWQQGKYWIYYDAPEKLEDSVNDKKTAMIHRVKTLLRDHIQAFELIIQTQATKTTPVLSALFEFIQMQNVYQYISQHKSHKFEARYLSHVTEAQYQETVWKQLIYIFEQVELALGKQPYQKDTLLAALILGLKSAEFTSVPQGFDAVMIGDFARTKFQTIHQDNRTKMGVQYAYIVGLNDRFLPHQEQSLNILSAAELAALQQEGVLTDILLEDQAINYQLFHFYTLITSAAKEVHLSYYQRGGLYLEDEYFLSPVVKSLTKGFGIPIIDRNNDAQEQNVQNMSIAAAKNMLLRDYQRHAASQSDLWKVIKHAEPLFLETLNETTQFKNAVSFTGKLRLPDFFSVTQIETYNSCPYKYFLKYVLKVKEPAQEVFQPMQKGNLLHGAYEMLALQAQEQKIKVNELADPEALVKAYFAMNERNMANHPLFHLLSNKYMYHRTEQMLRESLPFMLKSEEMSSFMPKYIEYEVPRHQVSIGKEKVNLVGRLDRIDFDASAKYLRIIDYKSSRKTLDFNKLLYGTQLQLPVYSYLTAQKFAKKLAASMYVPLVDNDVLLDTPHLPDEEIKTKMQKNYQATGLFLDDAKSLLALDYSLAEDDKSQMISYDRTKDGQASAHAMVFKEEELAAVQDFAMRKVSSTLQGIVEQTFPVAPLREDFDYDSSPCKYCPFRSVCQFDQKINCYSEKEKRIRERSFVKKKEQFLKIMNEKENVHE